MRNQVIWVGSIAMGVLVVGAACTMNNTPVPPSTAALTTSGPAAAAQPLPIPAPTPSANIGSSLHSVKAEIDLPPGSRLLASNPVSVRTNSEHWSYDVSQSDMVAWLRQRLPVGQPFHGIAWCGAPQIDGQTAWEWISNGERFYVQVTDYNLVEFQRGPAAFPCLRPQSAQQTIQPQQPTIQTLSDTDAQGFVNYPGARCNHTNPAVAIARTAQSLVVICQTGVGRFYYRGYGLQNGLSVEIDDPVRNGTGFVATNNGVRYSLSRDELTITRGSNLLSHEPMLEFWSG